MVLINCCFMYKVSGEFADHLLLLLSCSWFVVLFCVTFGVHWVCEKDNRCLVLLERVIWVALCGMWLIIVFCGWFWGSRTTKLSKGLRVLSLRSILSSSVFYMNVVLCLGVSCNSFSSKLTIWAFLSLINFFVTYKNGMEMGC